MTGNRAGDRTRTGDVHAPKTVSRVSNTRPDTRLHGIIPSRNCRSAPKSRAECATNVQFSARLATFAAASLLAALAPSHVWGGAR